jgi:hypothetical protein
MRRPDQGRWSLIAGVEIEILEQPALDDPLRGVKPQETRRDFAHRRQGLNNFTIQSEVVTPEMSPGVKQWDRLTVAVQRRDVRTFIPVAENTSIG